MRRASLPLPNGLVLTAIAAVDPGADAHATVVGSFGILVTGTDAEVAQHRANERELERMESETPSETLARWEAESDAYAAFRGLLTFDEEPTPRDDVMMTNAPFSVLDDARTAWREAFRRTAQDWDR